MNKYLSFGNGNSKLSKQITTFSLPAGHTCPFAKICRSAADRTTGKLTDGPFTTVRCFSASQECYNSAIRASRWNNYDLLLEAKTLEEQVSLIHNSLPANCLMVRIHVSGDFFSETYFLAWLNVAISNPHVIFYGYTKATPWLIKYKKQIPSNFRMVASMGGVRDDLIFKHKLKYAEIVFSPLEADDKGLELDHDDSHAYSDNNQSFALLLHGVQPKNTEASKAICKLRKMNMGGYSKKNKNKTIIPNINIVMMAEPIICVKMDDI